MLTLPRVERYLPETLNELQVEQLLNALPHLPADPLNLRNRAMLELLYASGLRISELTGARLENLRLDEGMIGAVKNGKGKSSANGATRPAPASPNTKIRRAADDQASTKYSIGAR